MTAPTHRPILALIVVGLASAACSSAAAPATSTPTGAAPASASPSSGAGGTTQTSEGGQVTLEATWAGPTAGLVFELKADTHSVNLDALDLATATLANDRGQTLTGATWAAPNGGHHREGALTFNGDATSFLAGAKSIQLVLRGVGDLPERTLRWEIGA